MVLSEARLTCLILWTAESRPILRISHKRRKRKAHYLSSPFRSNLRTIEPSLHCIVYVRTITSVPTRLSSICEPKNNAAKESIINNFDELLRAPPPTSKTKRFARGMGNRQKRAWRLIPPVLRMLLVIRSSMWNRCARTGKETSATVKMQPTPEIASIDMVVFPSLPPLVRHYVALS